MTTIHSTSTIRAALRGTVNPGKSSGIGTIRISDTGTTVLQTGNESIPVVLPDTTTLNSGQSVRYHVTGDTVRITPDPGTTVPGMPTEMLTLSQTEEMSSTPASDVSPVTFSVLSPEPGMYLFSSIDELQKATGTAPDAETLRQLKAILATEGVIALRISPANNGTYFATTWPLEDIPVIIGQLTGSLSENLFSSLSADVLKQLLFDRGALPFEPLMQLDRLFRSTDLPLPEQRAGSADAQKQALLQWLHTALSTDLTSAGTFALAPVTPAGTMVTDIEPVITALSASSVVPIPSAGSFALTETEGPSPSDPPLLLTNTSERIGYTLETTLARSSGQTMFPPHQTLKSLLQHLLHIHADGNNNATTSPPPPSAPETAASPLQGSQPKPFPGGPSGKLATVLDRLRVQLTALLRTDTPYPPQQSSDVPANGAPVSHPQPAPDFSGSLPPSSFGNSMPVGISPELSDLIDTTIALLDRYGDQSATARSASDMTQPLTAKTLQVRELLHALAAELSGRHHADSSARSPSPEFSSDTTGTILPLSEKISALAGAVLNAVEKLFDNEATIRPDPESIITRADTTPRDRAALSATRTTEILPESLLRSPASIARALGTALDRLESLQLLARRIPTTQGTRQIIALPIRFGATWTEINVRFLHQKKKGKKRKGTGQVSVAIDVAPPALGGLSANLRYHPSRKLNATIAFERSITRKWFSRHREEIQQALLQTGMKTVQLDLCRKRPVTASVKQDPGTGGDTLIDMKV